MSCFHFSKSNIVCVDGEDAHPCELCYLLSTSDTEGVIRYLDERGHFQFEHRIVDHSEKIVRYVNTVKVQNDIGKLLSKFSEMPHVRTAILHQIQLILSLPTKPHVESSIRDGLFATYHSERLGIFGCNEYIRGCHIQCPDCEVSVCCRLCHDRAEPTHTFRRKDVTTMTCSYCSHIQPVSNRCVNCRARMAEYYCDKCHLFDCPPTDIKIFHCDKCGECRKCKVDKSIKHCDTCGVCVFEPHECFKYTLSESTCSICGEGLMHTRQQASFPPCGHWTHHQCLERYVRTTWASGTIPTCPLCRKSVVNLTVIDGILDRWVMLDQMPPELANRTTEIHCNECGKDSTVPFHYKYWKCPHCLHYNTQKQ